MNRRRELFHFEVPEDGNLGGAEASVPGTGEATPDGAGIPAAEPTNTDPPARDLGPIPYSRFKEVNERRRELEDQLQPMVELEAQGYGVDDLQRLAAWEREFQQDPVAVWLRQAGVIEGMPESVKAAIEAATNGAADGPKEADADPTPPTSPTDLTPKPVDDEPPSWAKPLLEDYQARREAERAEAVNGTLDALTRAWADLDTEANIPTPSTKMMYRYLRLSEGATPAEVLRSARTSWLEDREETLSASVVRPGTDGSTAPRAVPGSGAGAGNPEPVVAKTLKEATRQALHSLERSSL